MISLRKDGFRRLHRLGQCRLVPGIDYLHFKDWVQACRMQGCMIATVVGAGGHQVAGRGGRLALSPQSPRVARELRRIQQWTMMRRTYRQSWSRKILLGPIPHYPWILEGPRRLSSAAAVWQVTDEVPYP